MARPQSPEKKLHKIQAPATETEKTQWEKACAIVEQDPAKMLRNLVAAFVTYVDRHGHFTSPVEFVPPERRRPKRGK